MHLVNPQAGAPAPTCETPDYLQVVFNSPDLFQRATAIARLLTDEDQDAALSLLALLARRETGLTAAVLNASGYLLLHRAQYLLTAAAPEARAA